MQTKTRVMLAIAVFMGLMTALLLNSYIKRIKQDTGEKLDIARVVVAKKNIAKGTLLVESVLASRPIPLRFLPSDVVFARDYEIILRQSIQVPLKAGKPVLWSYLSAGQKKTFSKRIPVRKRAVTIGVDELTGVAGNLSSYDSVDVLLTSINPKSTAAGPVTTTLLQNITILCTGHRKTQDQPLSSSWTKSYSSVTLSLNPLEAELITFAQDYGKITLILRNPDDNEKSKLPRIDRGYINTGLNTTGSTNLQ